MTFARLFVPPALIDTVSDRAWVQAMLDAESALAKAEARAGVIPAAAATAISEKARAELVDVEDLAEQGRAGGNPAEPLVRWLRSAVGEDAADYVHWGATSQDVVDTASMLVARRALDLILADLDAMNARLSELAETHRSTPMAARTLLQQAVPTTFGFKVAGWLVGLLEARRRLQQVRRGGLAAQLGGAGGTLAALGDQGESVLRLFSEELELVEPVLPWHTNRTRLAELGSALDLCAGGLGKVALDVALLAQTEVGEVREGSPGASSTMPHKQNPVGSTLARGNARLVSAYASVLTGSLGHEHERAAGFWHAEWEALSGALAHTGGAVASMRGVADGLEVDTDRMRANLDLGNGSIMAERLSFVLADRVGRERASGAVREAALRATATGRTLKEELQLEDGVDLSAEELDEALDPTTYLGSAAAFVDRALEQYRQEGT